jgi:hypothetical protein
VAPASSGDAALTVRGARPQGAVLRHQGRVFQKRLALKISFRVERERQIKLPSGLEKAENRIAILLLNLNVPASPES